MKNYIVITGGAGFVGSNLASFLLRKTNKMKIISLDNYSSGSKKNHIDNKRITYLNGDTKNISNILKIKKKFIPFFILENLQEFIKVLKILMNVMIQIQLAQNLFLNFV